MFDYQRACFRGKASTPHRPAVSPGDVCHAAALEACAAGRAWRHAEALLQRIGPASWLRDLCWENFAGNHGFSCENQLGSVYNQVRNWWHMLKARNVWRMPHWNLLVSYGNVQRLQCINLYYSVESGCLRSAGNILELLLWIYKNPPKSDQISYGLCRVWLSDNLDGIRICFGVEGGNPSIGICLMRLLRFWCMQMFWTILGFTLYHLLDFPALDIIDVFFQAVDCCHPTWDDNPHWATLGS